MVVLPPFSYTSTSKYLKYSTSLIATVHLNIQIPQLVTHSEYLIFTILFKHTSSDIYALQIYLIL